jgi:ElaB/YqjD/DUF883 family membrane-anchored ribosome-binding protein
MRQSFMSSNKRPAVTAEDFRQNVQALQNDLSRLTQQATLLFGDAGDRALGEVTDRIHWLGKSVDEAVSVAGRRGRKALFDASGSVAGGLQDALTRHPLATLALAAGIGVIFGSLSTRR